MLRTFFLVTFFGLTTSLVHADPIEFDFLDPKGVNSINFLLDSDLEPISGVVHGITGTVKFDPKKPKATTGTIKVETKAVHVPNSGMKKKLQTPEWLSVAEHPAIEFKVDKVKSAKQNKKDGRWMLEVTGTFTILGKKKQMTVPVVVQHLPGAYKKRNHRGEGDLLVLRSEFTVKRSDFGLGPQIPVVADEMQITMAIVGGHLKK
ncbi:MAG: YceI family protein [Planctomycetota bacterium]